VLSALLAFDSPTREVLGLDPDPRKISWARASVGAALPSTRFEALTLEQLAATRPAPFDAIAVCDVLYLLPLPAWPAFFAAARALLAPTGLLLLKETFDDGGWRTRKCLAQEALAVRVLRRTHSSGALQLHSISTTLEHLAQAGFAVPEILDLRQTYTSPHVLFCAACA
jgi:2-polyprenyl-6-hydroxyphenyl methylase/3-demethylubiquinone-9 3-methyltransferase